MKSSRILGAAALTATLASAANAALVTLSGTAAYQGVHYAQGIWPTQEFEATLFGVNHKANQAWMTTTMTVDTNDIDMSTVMAYNNTAIGETYMSALFNNPHTTIRIFDNAGNSKAWEFNGKGSMWLGEYAGKSTFGFGVPGLSQTESQHGLWSMGNEFVYNMDTAYNATPNVAFFDSMLQTLSTITPNKVNSMYATRLHPESSPYAMEFSGGMSNITIPSAGALGTLAALGAITAPRRRREMSMA